MKEKLLSIFETFKGCYIHLDDLCNELMTSTNIVKKAVQELRKDGVAIISNKNGYKLTEDHKEIQLFLASMTRQAVTRFNSIKQLASDLERDPNQMSIYSEEEKN